MVSFKFLLLSAAAVVGITAQEPPAPTGDSTAATAFWQNAKLDAAVDISAVTKRNDDTVLADPYNEYYCRAPYTEPPCETTCNRNNCFRGFLNARDGSDGKHCPSEAYGFCCLWNSVGPFFQWVGVESGLVFAIAPYAQNCEDKSDSTWDVINKIDDVCGCTLDHEVDIDVTGTYFSLRKLAPYNPKCH